MAQTQLTTELLNQHLEALEYHLTYFSHHGSAESTALGSLATTLSPNLSQPTNSPINRPLKVPKESFSNALARLGCEVFFLCALASPRGWIQLAESDNAYVLSLHRWWCEQQATEFSKYAADLYYTYAHLISLRDPTAPRLHGTTPMDGGLCHSLMTTYATSTRFLSHERPRVETKWQKNETSLTETIRGWERSMADDMYYVNPGRVSREFRNTMLVNETGVGGKERSHSIKYEISSEPTFVTPTNLSWLHGKRARNIDPRVLSYDNHEGPREPVVPNVPGGAGDYVQDVPTTAPPWYGSAELNMYGWENGYSGQGMEQPYGCTLPPAYNWDSSTAYLNEPGSYPLPAGGENVAMEHNAFPGFVGQTPVGQVGDMQVTGFNLAWNNQRGWPATEAEQYLMGQNYF